MHGFSTTPRPNTPAPLTLEDAVPEDFVALPEHPSVVRRVLHIARTTAPLICLLLLAGKIAVHRERVPAKYIAEKAPAKETLVPKSHRQMKHGLLVPLHCDVHEFIWETLEREFFLDARFLEGRELRLRQDERFFDGKFLKQLPPEDALEQLDKMLFHRREAQRQNGVQ